MPNPNQIEAASFSVTSQFAHPGSSTSVNSRCDGDSARAAEQSQISKEMRFIGELYGAGALYVDGTVKGNITLTGGKVTVGRNGRVDADIVAREIVVMGKVRGNLSASDRVDIRAEGSIVGNVIEVRLSIEEGAFLKCGIDLKMTHVKPESMESSAKPVL